MLRRWLRSIFGIRLKSVYIYLLYLVAVGLFFYLGQYSASIIFSQNVQKSFYGCRLNINKTLSTKGDDISSQSRVNRDSKAKRIKTFLLIIILTGPKNFDRRNAVRYTWLNVTKFPSVSRRFVIGTSGLDSETRSSLEQEESQYGDLLLLQDFRDAYNQLTRKLLDTLLWINDNVDCSFVMKVDDDTFARLDIIEQELKIKYHKIDNLYWGFHRGKSRVKYVGPWAEPKWILCDLYLPYALGGGYILSSKLVEYVANISSLLVLYNSEDVSLGTWLSPIELTRVHDPRFDTEWMSRGCRNAHIVSHKQSIEDMYNKNRMLQNHRKLCIKEEFLKKSYIYSWNVPPSQCCNEQDGIP